MQTIITIKGTHCKACKMLIEDVCRDIPGVSSCSVDFATGKTEVEHREALDWQIFKKEIESVGNYQVIKYSPSGQSPEVMNELADSFPRPPEADGIQPIFRLRSDAV